MGHECPPRVAAEQVHRKDKAYCDAVAEFLSTLPLE
jgi:hypothetical protein